MKKLLPLVFCVFVSCGGGDSAPEGEMYPKSWEDRQRAEMGKLTGEEGIVLFNGSLFGGGEKGDSLDINSYLWSAALDYAHKLPITEIDPKTGSILTDWYKINPQDHDRYKINIFVTSSELRSDSIKVAAFSQHLQKNGQWSEEAFNNQLATEIEDGILIRARNIKYNSGK
jgi:hypothetical protein